MGFFLDLKISNDLNKLATEINNCFLNSCIQQHRYNVGDPIRPEHKPSIRRDMNFIQNKLEKMEDRMQDISSAQRMMTCMVPWLDGHMTAVPGYISSMTKIVTLVTDQLNKD